ncbi:MAG: HD domain-containing protein [Treponema sp.]|nr:HD domain-containing protein [Treponema sp.]
MNYFEPYNWKKMINSHPSCNYSLSEYFEILCPKDDYPAFIDKYLSLDILQRLKEIGLLCGTDWTSLYKNRFYYSRFDHSFGVALIIWHFTHDKKQTLAGLFHDIATPVFSHVSDFRKGDALTQTATEEPTSKILRSSKKLEELLKQDELCVSQIENYHIYPVADNEIPNLSADRLEYMFPSGMALDGSWTMDEIKLCYNDIIILKNENNVDELGFKTKEIAKIYCRHFCMIGHILQLNENKLTLQLLGEIMNLSEKLNVLCEKDFMTLSEQQILEKIELFINKDESETKESGLLKAYYRTFRNMKKIRHTSHPLKNHFCVSLNVKQRYINPLVQNGDKSVRLYEISEASKKIIDDFLKYKDSDYGCVKLIK